jgi:predicted thioredoxin/glutaredoxin
LEFLLYSRPGCCLCDEMLAELAEVPAAQGLSLEVRDVDLDPETRIRYGHKVPVLLFAGELVCHGRLDREELDKVLRFQR